MNGNYKLLLEGILFVLAVIAVYGAPFMFRDTDAAAQTAEGAASNGGGDA